MKRGFIRWILLLSLLWTFPVLAEQTEAIVTLTAPTGQEEYVRSLCYVGETLYVLGNCGIYRCDAQSGEAEQVLDLSEASMYAYMTERPEDEESAAQWERAVSLLFELDGELFALNSNSGQILRVAEGDMQAVAQLPQALLAMREEGFGLRQFLGAAGSGGKLYLLLGPDDYNEYDKRELVIVDLTAMEAETAIVKNAEAIAPADEGILVLVCGDSPALMRFADGGLTALASVSSNVGGIAWNAAQKSAVLLESGCLYAAGGQEPLAYVPVPYLSFDAPAGCSAGGMYAVASGKYVFLRDLASGDAAKKTVLRVIGSISQENMIAFLMENPDLALVTNGTEEDARSAVLTGDSSVDVLILQAPGDFAAFADKGYLLPLEDEALSAWVDTLYPAIAQTVLRSGELMAVPIWIQPDSWMVNEEVWQRLGLGDYPADYDALYACIARWLDEYAQDNPDYTLADIQQTDVTSLLQQIVRSYILEYEQPGETLTFDTPAFRYALEGAAQNGGLLSEEYDQWGMPLINSYYLGFGEVYTDSDRNIMLLPPALTPGGERQMSATLQVMAVHSASAHPEAAMRFICWMAQNLQERTLYEMTPSLTEPVENARYASRVEEITQDIEALRARLAQEEDAEAIDELESQIAYWENILDSRENMRYDISPRAISLYREAAENMTIHADSAFLNSSSVMSSIDDTLSRICGDGFSEGEIDALIAQLDRVIHMAAGE